METTIERTVGGRRARGPKPSSVHRAMVGTIVPDKAKKKKRRKPPIGITNYEYQKWLLADANSPSKKIADYFRLSPSERQQKYLQILGNRPRWAKRYMERLAATGGGVHARILEGAYWMCWRAGFKPLRDDVWDWWKDQSADAQVYLYLLGVEWRRLGREIKAKDDPVATFANMVALPTR